MEKEQPTINKGMNKIVIAVFICLLPTLTFAQNLANFTQVGPVKFPDNPSVQTTGMGRVSRLVYHPKDSNVLFAVTSSGGVFKSSNEGTSWTPISDFLPQTYCASLAINPQNPNVMYLGTGDANYDVNYFRGGIGVWKTLDGGKSWFQASNGLGNKLVSNILMTPGDTSTLIAACADGIYKSTNAGAIWFKMTTVNISYRDLKYQPNSNRVLYSASNTHFYTSHDNGSTWSQSKVSNAITSAGIHIAVCPKDTSKVFCVVWKTGAASPFGGVYKSINNGATFTLQCDTPNILGYSADGTSMDGQGAYNLAITVDPTDANVIYVAGINIWKSTNQGVTFSLKSHWAYGVHADKHGILFSPFNPNKLFVYHDGGIDRSTDGGNTWTTLEDGLSASEFYQMGSSGLYNDHIIGGLQDNGMDVARDKKFQTVRGGDWGGDFAFDAFDKQIVYENGGIKRNMVTHVTGNINGKGGIYAVHPNDSNVLFEATKNVYRTKNIRTIPTDSVTWTQLSNFSGTTKQVDMAYSKSSKGIFYAAFTPQSLYRTTDINTSTPTFVKITSIPFKSGEEIKQLQTCDYDTNIIYLVTNQARILKSTDKGNSWTNMNYNLPSISIIKFLLDQKAGDSSMYVCNALGVYYRNKFMNKWITFSQGLPTICAITDMEIMSDGTSNSRLHVSTWGRGIWQTDLFKSNMVPPVADFAIHPSTNQTCVNTVILVDNSIFSPTERKWQISPNKGYKYLNGTDSTSLRPEIQFTTSGMYFISLFVANNAGSNIKILNYNYSPLSKAANCATTTTTLGGYTIGIYQFELNTLLHSSSTGNSSYEDFSCVGNTLLKPNTTYTAWVTNGNNYNENAKIYIDYNNNGSFTDANELVGTITNGKGRRSCTFTTLTNPPVTNTYLRLRVVSDYYAFTDPCGNLGYGQSEDYAVYFDNAKPSVTIDLPNPIVSSSFEAIFETSEMVFGFDASDISVTNGNLSNFVQTSATTYKATISPINNGTVKVDVLVSSFKDLGDNFNAPASRSTEFFLGIKSFTFTGISVSDSLLQTPTGGAVICTVPFGTSLKTLVANFILSDSSTAFIGSQIQISSISTIDYSSDVTFTIKAKDTSLTKSYTIQVIEQKNTECNLFTFGFSNPAVSGTIIQKQEGGTVNITVPYNTPVNNLSAYFTISDSAKAYVNSIRQISGTTTNDFGLQLSYTIIAQDTNYAKTYLVNLYFGKSQSCDILSYSIQSPSTIATITSDSAGNFIRATLPFGTDLSELIALFKLSDSAQVYVNSILQQTGITVNNFTSIVEYKVVAHDTNFSKIYNVELSILPNNECELISYDIATPSSFGKIKPETFGGYVAIEVPIATPVNNLIAQFKLSDSAHAFVNSVLQQSGISQNNYTDTLVFMVMAQDGKTSKRYLIHVELSTVSNINIKEGKLVIFPNPAKNELRIDNDAVAEIDNIYTINTVLGQLVKKDKLKNGENTIDISQLASGIYYLNIRTKAGMVVGKFIKE
jgi:photosystem II stability/assembly factor-like uncharacterized protein